jgi:hypothetical protein
MVQQRLERSPCDVHSGLITEFYDGLDNNDDCEVPPDRIDGESSLVCDDHDATNPAGPRRTAPAWTRDRSLLRCDEDRGEIENLAFPDNVICPEMA